MYECAICYSLNHASRLHCQNCGTIPAQYSIYNRPINALGNDVVVAFGSVRTAQHHTGRVYLRTVALDYYAE